MSDFGTFDNTAAMYRAGQVRIDSSSLALKHTLASTKLDAKTLDRINVASKDFEANFLNEMMKPMFEGIQVDETFGGGKGEEVFRDFLVQEYSKKMADRGGIGIATAVRDQMIKMQEASIK
jgi:flagellar protein FlgJ